MELDRFPLWIEQRLHQIQFLFDVIEIITALFLIGRNYRRAAAKPAKRLAKRQMEIEREIARRGVIRANLFQESRRRNLIGEMRRRRIGRITRPGHVVLLHQFEIYFELAHTYSQLLTVS